MDVQAAVYTRVEDSDGVKEALAYAESINKQVFILGGGSNILFTKNVDALVIHNAIPGIQIIKEDAQHVWVKAGAGVVWHELVLFALQHNLGGIENLALIPGNAGAAPIQNIGAYGVELKDVFDHLTAIEIETGEEHFVTVGDCAFGYRDSVFKNAYKNKFVITSIVICLSKTPQFKIEYGAIQQELGAMQVSTLSVTNIAQAVMHIRNSKLPDPAIVGNAGSFFKNPVVSRSVYDALKQSFPDMPGYVADNHTVKIAAGWLIEHSHPQNAASWKGYRKGDAGCHAKQALVLVNYGHAKGEEIVALSNEIIDSVLNKFGIQLEREVNFY
jgi:UDP-N-acetylmuramate dehydrogenase